MSHGEYCTTATSTFIFQNSASEITGKDAANPHQQNHLQQMLPEAGHTLIIQVNIYTSQLFIFFLPSFFLNAVDKKKRLQYSGMLCKVARGKR